MKAVGVIVEYNPFHNGHVYHLQETINQTCPDLVIAVMSGQFLQRGEPALVSKWARTEMALKAGIDIILELPYLYATQNAETFANGAISLLHAMHCDEVCFGSENGAIEDFQQTYQFLEQNEDEYTESLKIYLKKGISYPKAASLAYSDLNFHDSFLDLSKPNNILGYYYVKAIHDTNSGIIAQTIKRTSADYHDQSFNTTRIASATSIRKTLLATQNDIDEILKYVPIATKDILENYYKTYKEYHHWELYFPFLKLKLLTLSKEELREICEIEEGIENRLKACILNAQSFKEFIEAVKTKRYTWTRLQRMCLHILTHTCKEEMVPRPPTYIRLLGMSVKGQEYLNVNKKRMELPIITNVSSFQDQLLNLDIKATYAYGCIFPEPARTKFIKKEYSTPPLRYDAKKKELL